jgi:hypothetical protein
MGQRKARLVQKVEDVVAGIDDDRLDAERHKLGMEHVPMEAA